MASDLTTSPIDRQNILNNQFAVTEIQRAAQIKGVHFEGAVRLIKEQVAAFFEIDVRTVERYLTKHGDELGQNGYEVIKGKRLKLFKESVSEQFATDIDVGSKNTQLGLFGFRAFLKLKILHAISKMPHVTGM